jgi:hypothetical protein
MPLVLSLRQSYSYSFYIHFLILMFYWGNNDDHGYTMTIAYKVIHFYKFPDMYS